MRTQTTDRHFLDLFEICLYMVHLGLGQQKDCMYGSTIKENQNIVSEGNILWVIYSKSLVFFKFFVKFYVFQWYLVCLLFTVSIDSILSWGRLFGGSSKPLKPIAS